VAAHGTLSMGVVDRAWVLPRSRALWIPAAVPHTVDAIGSATMTALWFDPRHCPVPWTEPTVVEVDDLVAALVARLVGDGLDAGERRRSEAVLFDVLRPVATTVLLLPVPEDDRARRVAEALLDDPADDRTLVAWGRTVGASDRTLMRAFRAETGVGFHEWRTRARITAALPHLAAGAPVALVASRVGYGTASALTAAFRRTMGTTPSAYFGTTAAGG
jgi:AraC-like DNA-binding protein